MVILKIHDTWGLKYLLLFVKFHFHRAASCNRYVYISPVPTAFARYQLELPLQIIAIIALLYMFSMNVILVETSHNLSRYRRKVLPLINRVPTGPGVLKGFRKVCSNFTALSVPWLVLKSRTQPARLLFATLALAATNR